MSLSEDVLKAYERFCPGILCDLMHEIVRAEKLHGPLPTNQVRAQTIAGEELGEVCGAALDLDRDYIQKPYPAKCAHLREEWIQLAAVALRAVENLDKEDRGAKNS